LPNQNEFGLTEQSKIYRKRNLAISTGLALAIVLLIGQGSPAQTGYNLNNPRVKAAVDRGCRYLVSKQLDGVGAYGTSDRLAITSMATLSLLSTGSTPRRGPYAENILEAVRWVVSRQKARGHFWDSSTGYSQIHNHGYALLLLTQVYGECGRELDQEIARAIPRAIRASLASQHRNGGFGYFLYRRPPAGNRMMIEDEASTTISQIQALRGARNAGFTIPARMLKKAERYIYNSQHQPTGGFYYSLKTRQISFQEGSKTPTFAITAAAACVLNSLGTYKGDNLNRAINYIQKFRPETEEDVHFFYYGHFYASQVMKQIGGRRGQQWRKAVAEELIKRQRSNGSYPRGADSHIAGTDGTLLNTAWSVQVLTMDDGFLPIYER
jgi:hypothetical protein